MHTPQSTQSTLGNVCSSHPSSTYCSSLVLVVVGGVFFGGNTLDTSSLSRRESSWARSWKALHQDSMGRTWYSRAHTALTHTNMHICTNMHTASFNPYHSHTHTLVLHTSHLLYACLPHTVIVHFQSPSHTTLIVHFQSPSHTTLIVHFQSPSHTTLIVHFQSHFSTSEHCTVHSTQ